MKLLTRRMFIKEKLDNELKRDLLEARQRGDMERLIATNDAIFNLYSKPILDLLHSGLPTRQDAEELAAEVFIRFLRPRFRGECSIWAYLRTIAKNLCKDFFKSPKRCEFPIGRDRKADEPDGKGEILDRLEDPTANLEDQYLLRSAWLTLSQKDRLLLSGLPGTELAKILKVSQSTVTRRRQEALARFRAALLDAGDPYPT